MTSTYNGPSESALRALLTEARCVLLDFDGPVCRLFSRRPADQVAEKMRQFLGERVQDVTDTELLSSDPHRVLMALAGHELVVGLETLLSEEEELAARSAQPTPQADEFIRAVADSGRVLAITTNNAPTAVETYLTHHGLDGFFERRIFGRVAKDPALMKPHPDCLLRAVDASGLRPEQCLMVGDSPADAAAAKAAGVRFLGYAADTDRVARLRTADPHPVVVGMPPLVAAARSLLPPNG